MEEDLNLERLRKRLIQKALTSGKYSRMSEVADAIGLSLRQLERIVAEMKGEGLIKSKSGRVTNFHVPSIVMGKKVPKHKIRNQTIVNNLTI